MHNRSSFSGSRFVARFALLGCLMLPCARAARAEVWNSHPSFCTCGTSTTYIIVFQGNIIANLNLVATQSDTGLNPFALLDQKMSLPNTSTVTAALDSHGNTVVTFSANGGPGINSSQSADFTSTGGLHFGLDPASNPGVPLKQLSQNWSSQPTQPVVSLKNPTLGVGTVKYEIYYLQLTSGAGTVGNWYEIPYTGTYPATVFTNPTGSTETLSNVGFMLSPTLIPLDQLNAQDEPPPGMGGSNFTPLPKYDGSFLSPNQSLGVPDQSSLPINLALCGGAIGLAIWRRRQGAARTS